MILERPNHFGQLTIILVGYKLFWLGPNHFGQVQIRLFWTNFYNLNLSKMIWIQPKQIESDKNDYNSNKMIWTVQNHFGPIEGQGISIHLYCISFSSQKRQNWLLIPTSAEGKKTIWLF